MTKTPRSYVIDVDSSTSRYPIIFTEAHRFSPHSAQ